MINMIKSQLRFVRPKKIGVRYWGFPNDFVKLYNL